MPGLHSVVRRLFSPESARRSAEQHGALKVLAAQLRREGEHFGCARHVAVRERGSGEVVVGVEQIGVDANRFLELVAGLGVVPR